jgi:hypothetical protein
MKKLFALLMVLALVAACGGGQEDGSQSAGGATNGGQGGAGDQTSAGQPAIGEGNLDEFERTVAGFLRPYFDEAGTDTTLDVAPGEQFEMWVVAEYNEAFAMSAAEYKLVLPGGVSLLGTVQSDSTIITLGKHEEDFMMAFRCMPGPKNWLVKYLCKAEDDFAGGVVETVRGQNLDFIGFATCDVSKTMVRAQGGTAELGKK